MAELMFKRGTQDSLNTIIAAKQAIDGCFYLTSDTNRLYIGQGDNTAPVLLNQTVQIVDKVASLPASPPAEENDFYYCIHENILAVYTADGWTQINPNTNDTIQVDGISFDEGTVNDAGTAVEYTLTLSQTKYDIHGNALNETEPIEPLTATLTIGSEMLSDIIPEAASVGLEAASEGLKSATIHTVGAGSDKDAGITLIGGSNIDSIEVEDNSVTINSHNTTISEIAATSGTEENTVVVTITDSDNTEHSINFRAGLDLGLTVEDGEVVYSHKVYDTDSIKLNIDDDDKILESKQLESEGTVSIISGLDIENGHVTGHTETVLTLPKDIHLKEVVRLKDDKNNDIDWVYQLVDNEDTTFDIDFRPEVTVLLQEISRTLAAANTALTYKNTISHPNALDELTGVEVGDVYLLDTNVTIGEESYRKGDLFIATSISGDAAGVIPDYDLNWTYVPSGDELIIDTKFAGVATVVDGNADADNKEESGSISFHIEAQKDIEDNINTPENNETIQLIAGDGLEIIDQTDDGGLDKKAVIRHQDIVTDETSGESTDAKTITAISDITVNNGHITDIVTTTYNVVSYELKGEDNAITLVDSIDNESSVAVEGDDWITAEVADNTLSIAHAGPGEAAENVVVENDTLTAAGDLNIITGISYDEKGHITQVDTETLTLPEDQDTTYELYVTDNADGPAFSGDDSSADPYIILENSHQDKNVIQFASANENLVVTGAAGQITFNMVWGTFDPA